MCGRYALSLRPSVVRQRLADQDMPADEAPDDEDDRIRQTYNFAPGYHGLIYRAVTSESGADQHQAEKNDVAEDCGEPSPKRAKTTHPTTSQPVDGLATRETKYKLQAAKWGLIPFWTKRPPDYAGQMRTINCRDDSLIENRGMWNTMKQRKRCIVVAEGFYEWLKKNNGKEKIPHFVKRKDSELMCFAGLWDMVKYEGSEDKLYTYTIITTDSNPQLKFLHDRMPVIMDPGSESMKTWLDPQNVGWSKELQSLLKPFQGELECYPVDRAVGKVGNNSPSFVVPIDSKDNKNNIANFFGSKTVKSPGKHVTREENTVGSKDAPMKHDGNEDRETDSRIEGTEDHAPVPKPKEQHADELEATMKRDVSAVDDDDMINAADEASEHEIKREISSVNDEELLQAASSPPKKLMKTEKATPSPNKASTKTPKINSKGTRNAVSNNTVAKTPTKQGNTRITSFFGK